MYFRSYSLLSSRRTVLLCLFLKFSSDFLYEPLQGKDLFIGYHGSTVLLSLLMGQHKVHVHLHLLIGLLFEYSKVFSS